MIAGKAGRGDLKQLVALEYACFDSFVAIKPRQWRRFLRQSPCPVPVIRVAGRLVADAVMLHRVTCRGLVGWLYSLAIDPAWRRRGLARKLLDHCISLAKKMGAYAVVLQVGRRNIAAIKLYESAGFRCAGDLPDYYGPNRHGLKMRKELKPNTCRPTVAVISSARASIPAGR